MGVVAEVAAHLVETLLGGGLEGLVATTEEGFVEAQVEEGLLVDLVDWAEACHLED